MVTRILVVDITLNGVREYFKNVFLTDTRIEEDLKALFSEVNGYLTLDNHSVFKINEGDLECIYQQN